MPLRRRYDYVVVGAGAAGCVLAGRLATRAKHVLLIEAGSATATNDSHSFFDALDDPGRTYPNLAVHSTNQSPSKPYLLGRGIGGGSAVNAMIATPGSAADYDHWERDLGCVGWGWSSLKWTLDSHALVLSQPDPTEWGSVDRALIEGAASLGHDYCPSYLPNGAGTGHRLGVGPAWLTRWDGRRVTAADAYLSGSRPQLTIQTETVVETVAFDGRRAIGVVTSDGELIEADEVIVAAGAIHSPALLLRSGVDRRGIGRGLKDHPSSRLTLSLREPNDEEALAAATLLRWSSPGDEADLQVLPLNHVGNSPAAGGLGGLIAAVMSVRSTGAVTLGSTDAAASPIVRLNLLDDDRDRVRLRLAARKMVSLVATPAFRRIVDDVFIDDLGTPLAALADDDATLDRWLVANVGDTFHAACTCRMGLVDDDMSVVDTAGRVHGYRNLRVCDASIFPDLPRANPYLPTVMVAEQIASLIIASW